MRQSGKFRLFGVLLSAVFLAACGGSGGGSSTTDSSTSTPSISGVVADGYLVGAKVCSDQNDNKQCDDGEPTATTGPGGSYTLEGDDLDLYPLIVEVSASVIDEDSGAAVGKPYVMSAPIPDDITIEQVINPITTLVQSQIDTDPTLNRDQAADLVKADLGVSDGVDLFEDFVAQEDAEYELLHAIARVIANVMADSQEAMAVAAEANEVTVEDLMTEIVTQVVEQLDTIVETVVAAQTSAGDTFDPADFDIATVPVKVAATEDIEGVANLDAYGIASAGRWGSSYIQSRTRENTYGIASGYITYNNQTGEPLASVISKVELYLGENLLGTQTTPRPEDFFLYDCLGEDCFKRASAFNGEYYYFSIDGALAAGTYRFETTLNDSDSTVLTTTIVSPGDVQLPVIDSTSQAASWDGDNLVLSWEAPTGVNADEIDQIRASIYSGPYGVYVLLPAGATTVSIPATILSPVGLTPTENFYSATWKMNTRAYDDDGRNYARGISNGVALPGVPPTGFSEENLAGKTLYAVWFGGGEDDQGNPIDNVAVVAKEVFDADGTVDITGLLNHGEYSDLSYGVTAGGLYYEDVVSIGRNIITCSTANYIKTDYNVDGVFDNVDLYFFEQSRAEGYAAGLTDSIPQGCP